MAQHICGCESGTFSLKQHNKLLNGEDERDQWHQDADAGTTAATEDSATSMEIELKRLSKLVER